jgi:hypothetical protein
VEVPSVAASRKCSDTTTAARISGFRGIPGRSLFRLDYLLDLFYETFEPFALAFRWCASRDTVSQSV